MYQRIKEIFKNPRHKKKWQGITGILVILCFVLSSVFVTNTILASKNAGYGYGYSSGSYGYGYQRSSALPSAISNLSCYATSGTVITCQFTAVTTATDSTSLDNFSSYKLYYSTSSSSANRTSGTAGGTSTTQGSASSTVTISTSSLTAATTYYFVSYTMDDNSNYSAISNVVTVATAGVNPDTGDPGTGPISSPVDEGEDEADVPADDDDEAEVPAEEGPVVPEQPDEVDTAAEQSATAEVTELMDGAPATDAEWEMVYYIAYGSTASSQTYSSRARRDIMYDYVQIFGTAPIGDAGWQDVDLMINGHRPHKRTLERERAGIEHFQKVYKRNPDWSNEHDTWAVVYMSYAVRYRPRSLDKERVAITTFRHIYGYTPSDATDWSVVRAIGYSGASR